MAKAKTKSSNLEKQVQEALKAGPKTNAQLRESLGQDPDSSYPPLDRTLQALRRTGKIQVLSNGRWTTKGAKICPHCSGRGWVKS